MKAIGIVAALAVAAVLITFMLSEPEPREEPTQPPPVDVPTEEPTQPSVLALPEEVGPLEEVEEVAFEEPEEFVWEEVDQPKIVSRKRLPDGRVEIKMLTPVYFGNGTKKTMLRTLRGQPRMIKVGAGVQERPKDTSHLGPPKPDPADG